MIKQNPFSLYDFLGYFIPGAMLFYIIILLNSKVNSLQAIIEVTSQNKEFQFDKVLFFIVMSYCIGHLINYLSSITIENFAIWKYDYPSKYLLGYGIVEENNDDKKRRYLPKTAKKRVRMFRILIAIFIIPITLLDYILSKWFLFKNYYTKKLDVFLVKVIKEKKMNLIRHLYPTYIDKIEEYDFHRVLSHYVYENSKNHQFKMANYVALYGFLRAMSLICCFLFWIFLVKAIKAVYFYYKNLIQIDAFKFSLYDFNIELFFILLLSLLVSYIYFMGFMKFYRRYTLEVYMVVATDKNLINNLKIANN